MYDNKILTYTPYSVTHPQPPPSTSTSTSPTLSFQCHHPQPPHLTHFDSHLVHEYNIYSIPYAIKISSNRKLQFNLKSRNISVLF